MPSYVLKFSDYEPSPRDDSAPWTQALIYEAAQQAGPFDVLIDTINLSPIDADPTDPQPRSFTTHNATMQSGWYQVVFVDDSNSQSPAEPVFHTSVGLGFLPGVGDVGAHLRIRTRDANGNELGTFTQETRPTRDQVERLIDSAAQRVTAKIGTSFNEALWGKARTTIALRAAALVELSFFADQISANRSPYTELKALAQEEWTELYSDWRDLGVDGVPGSLDDTGDGGLPIFSFPSFGAACRAPGSEFPVDPIWRDW